jgi:hypothetical protein
MQTTYNTNGSLYGVATGIYYGQNERLDELNTRLSDRHFPDMPLATHFSPRPVPTKYSHFPVIDRRTPAKMPLYPVIDHTVENNFYPGTQRGPASTFLTMVDKESALRNQGVALQHGGYQGIHIPSSDSDLYKVNAVGRQCTQTHPELFTKESYNTFVSQRLENSSIGKDRFHNNTRAQLRGGK